MRHNPKEHALVRSRLALYRRLVGHCSFEQMTDEGVQSGGRFRKRRPYDCGRSRCHLCHGEKLMGRKSLKQRLADQVEQDERLYAGLR